MKLIKNNLLALGIFFFVCLVYFIPILERKDFLIPGDILQYKGMVNEKIQYEKESDETVLWTNSMFGGMPTYLISTPKPPPVIRMMNRIMLLNGLRPLNFVWLYMVGFYIALLCFGVRWQLSIIGAIAFAFSSYLFIIIPVGHITKAITIGYMPPIIGGVYLAMTRKIFLGSAMTGMFLALQISKNHLQITYYTMLIVVVLGVFMLVSAYKNNRLEQFAKSIGALVIMVILALGSNATPLMTTYEYSKHSTRGGTELK